MTRLPQTSSADQQPPSSERASATSDRDKETLFLSADGLFRTAEEVASDGLLDAPRAHAGSQVGSTGSGSTTVYNFEVEGLHTYVAGGIRVHNQCIFDHESVRSTTFNANGDIVHNVENGRGDTIVLTRVEHPNGQIGLYRKVTFVDEDGITRTVDHYWGPGEVGPDDTPIGDGTFAVDGEVYNPLITGEQIGGVIGSAFGNALGDNALEDILFSGALDAVFSATGEAFDDYFNLFNPEDGTSVKSFGEAVEGAYSDFGDRLGSSIVGAGIGQVSSFIVGELIGGEGIAADLGRTVANGYISAALTDVVLDGALSTGAFTNFAGFNPLTAVASYFGSALASSIVQAEGEAAALVSSVLGSIGSIIGTVILPVIGTFIGQFVGEVFGALVGNALFGDEDFPRALGGVNVDANGRAVDAGSYTGVDGMDGIAIQPAVQGIVSGLNGMLDRFGPDARFAGVNGGGQLFSVGYISTDGYRGLSKGYTIANANTGSSFPSNTWSQAGFDQSDFNEAFKFAALHTVQNGLITGGDAWARRVLYYGGWETFEQMMDQLQIAVDYRNYLENKAIIDRLITEAPDSAFAVGWLVTLAQATTLGFTNPDALHNFIEGTAAAETLTGTIYNDEIIGKAGNDTLTGGVGNDLLNGGLGADHLDGGVGLDTASYRNSSVGVSVNLETGATVGGEAAGDTFVSIERLFGSDHNDVLIGDAGDNLLAGYGGSDGLYGGAGDDTIEGGAGADTLDGGAGYDIATYAGSSVGVKVTLQEGATLGSGIGGDAQGDTLTGFEAISGSLYSDILTGNSLDNMLLGSDGNDFLEGKGGADRLLGGSGADFAVYTSSDAGVYVNLATGEASGGHAEGDVFDSIEYVIGSAHDDIIIGDGFANVIEGGAGTDILDGGEGLDAVSYANSSAGIFIDLVNQTVRSRDVLQQSDATGDTIANFEHVIATNFNDVIIVGHDNAVILAGGGDDVITPFSGNVAIDGGDGFDTVDFSRVDAGGNFQPLYAAGLFTGSQVDDTIIFQGSDIYDVWADALAGVAIDVNSFGINTTRYDIKLHSIEKVTATEFDDRIAFNDLNQHVDAGGGDDHIIGREGADIFYGGTGNDTIQGMVGNDTIRGDAGADMLVGGEGNDFLYGGDGNDVVIGDRSLSPAADQLFQEPGAPGNDHLDGGAGNDELKGGDGNDTYYFGRGYGQDVITDVTYVPGQVGGGKYPVTLSEVANAGSDVLVLAEDILPDDIAATVSGDDLIISIIGTSDQIRLSNFNEAFMAIETVRFAATGFQLNLSGLTASAAAASLSAIGDGVLVGTGAADALVGTGGNDAMSGFASDDMIQGAAGNDTLDAGAGNDFLHGGAGNDALWGGTGHDRAVYLGNAQDFSISETAGTWTITDNNAADGNEGSDTLTGVEEASFNGRIIKLDGTNNAPFQVGSVQNHMLERGTPFTYTLPLNLFHDVDQGDTVSLSVRMADGRAVPAWLIFDAATRTLSGTPGMGDADRLDVLVVASDGSSETAVNFRIDVPGDVIGTEGDDTGATALQGLAISEHLYALGGADTILGSAGADRLDGGAGNDTVDYSGSFFAINVNLTTGLGHAGDAAGDQLTGIENVIGTWHADTIYGDSGNNIIDGVEGADWVDAGAGNDIIKIGSGGAHVIGGAGWDVVDLSDALARPGTQFGWNVSFSPTFSSPFSVGIVSVEEVIGTNFRESINGDANANTIRGGGGNDNLYGNAGNDILEGGAGADILAGAAGNDTASYEGSSAGVTVNLTARTSSGGDAEGDTITDSDGDGFSDIENLIGSSHDDLLYGDAGGNQLRGGAGNDQLTGLAGGDYLDGGEGSDFARYDASTAAVHVDLGTDTATGGYATGDVLDNIEHLVGSAHGDFLGGDANSNTLYGQGGNDTLYGRGGNDVLLGGAGTDALNGGDGIDRAQYTSSAAGININLFLTTAQSGGNAQGDILTSIEDVYGSNHADIISGDHSANTLWGYGGNDGIYGNGGNDTLYGQDGNDSLSGQGGADHIDGGAGSDTLGFASSAGGVTVNLATGTGLGADAEGDTYVNIENSHGSSHGDTLIGDAGVNVLSGLSGNDTLEGGAGADTLDGGAGVDTVSYAGSSASVTVDLAAGTGVGGDAQGDTLISIERVVGSADSDVFIGNGGANEFVGGDGADAFRGMAGADVLIGGAGNDVAYYDLSTSGITIDLVAGTGIGGNAQGDTLTGIERIVATNYNDSLTGDANDNVLYGLGGVDTINGGAGDDSLIGGAGADVLDGGAGVDWVRYDNSDAAVNINLFLATAQSGGYAQGDTYLNIENVVGSAHGDTIAGDHSANTLWGAGGNDGLYGNGGNDTIHGGDGNDSLSGQGGADHIDGGAGSDTLGFASSAGGVTVNLTTGVGSGADAEGDTYVNIENSHGSSHGDTLIGDAGVNVLSGLAGNDTLEGGVGADTLDGGAGVDTVSYAGSSAAVTVDLAAGTGVGGDAQGDTLISIESLQGSSHGDILTGNADDNFIDGGAGNDTLSGGEGTDTLNGGAGVDIAVFEGSFADHSVLMSGTTGTVSGATGTTSLVDIETLVFADQTINLDTVNNAPVARVPIADQTALIDVPLALDLSDCIVDIDSGDTLTYAVTLADGSPLPAWMMFDTATGVLGGTAVFADMGLLDIKLIATDAAGASSEATFNLNVNRTNTAPTVANAIAAQSADEDSLFSFVVPANTFLDNDQGEVLTYSATLDDGSALPTWLVFDAATGTFSGTPENHDVGVLSVRITATDQFSETAAADFSLAVQNTNDAPTAGNSSGTVNEGQSFSIDLATLVSDIDGDALAYSINSGPAAGSASISGSTLTYMSVSGQPGNYTIGYTVSDGQGGTANASIAANILDVNYAPTAVNDVRGGSYLFVETVASLLANDTDPDGDTLSIIGFSNFVNVTNVSISSIISAADNSPLIDLTITATAAAPISFDYTISDGHGNTSTATYSGNYVPYNPDPDPDPGPIGKPIVFDLDADGIELVDADESDIFFDLNGDGVVESTGWADSDDALLAYDKNGDGLITDGDEVSFVGYKEGARTDLEGLQAFDTNGDGVLDAADAEFGSFNIWQDVNQNGVSDAGELRSLSAAGIMSIALSSDERVRVAGDNISFGVGQYTRTDGTTGNFSDTGFGTGQGLGDIAAGLSNTVDDSGLIAGGDVVQLSASLNEVLNGNFQFSLVVSSAPVDGPQSDGERNIAGLISAMAAFDPKPGGEAQINATDDDRQAPTLAAWGA